MRKFLAVFLMVLSLMAAGASANAALMTYEYVGNPVSGSSDPFLTATLTVDLSTTFYTGTINADKITACSMQVSSMGLDLVDGTDGVRFNGSAIPFVTFVDGKISSWRLNLEQNSPNLLYARTDYTLGNSTYDEAYNGTFDMDHNYVVIRNNPGTWTLVTPTNPTAAPEPSVLMLLGMGLMGLVGLRKKVQK